MLIGLLLLVVPLPIGLLPAGLIASPHAADERTAQGTDGRALTGIAGDRATNRSARRSTCGATHQASLRGFVCGRRWRRRRRRVGRIVAALLDGPNVAVAAIPVLLFLALALGGIDVKLLGHGPVSGKYRHDGER